MKKKSKYRYTIRKISELKKNLYKKKEWFNKNKKRPKDISFVNDIERGFQHVNCILHIIIIIFTVQNRDSLIQYTYTCTIKYIT